ncbi:hypothetical protein ElyMa_004483700 [Elysia marginata]|uniref:Uncharacterized protein n=1 Tax=Elysia marginata TaxID=1093978 RepID=A0AAV4HKL8_9GAST|nr:hypothetical protein ElyMa_004483700 [Elysia marginata]
MASEAVTLKRVRPEETNELLKEAFEGGLQRATRAATAYLFTADRSLDQLQLEVKRKERELGLLQPVTVAAAQDSQLTKLAAQINQLQTEIREIQKTQRPRQERAVESLAGRGQSPRGVPERQPRERGPIQSTRCTNSAPVVIGTNLLPALRKVTSPTPAPLKMAIDCVEHRDSRIGRQGAVALLQCATEQQVELSPNQRIILPTRARSAVRGYSSHVVVEPTPISSLPTVTDVDISPTVHLYPGNDGDEIDVILENCSTRTLWVSPGETVARLLPVIITAMCAEAGNVKLPTIDTAKLSEEQQQDVQSLLEEYKDIFSQSDTDIGRYTGSGYHHIDIREDHKREQRLPSDPLAFMSMKSWHLDCVTVQQPSSVSWKTVSLT